MMKMNFKGAGSINIDGRDFKGTSVEIKNGIVWIDGVQQPGELIGDVSIQIDGDVDKIETATGNIRCGKVRGSVHTAAGDVTCGNVEGSVNTMSGDIQCLDVSGSVSTMSGDVRKR